MENCQGIKKRNGELGVIFVNTFISALLFRLGNVRISVTIEKAEVFCWISVLRINYHKHYINRYAFYSIEYIGNKYVLITQNYRSGIPVRRLSIR